MRISEKGMMKIESYRFGQIAIEGKTYASDLIIFPDRVESDWWREEGHQLRKGDLDRIVRDSPEILVVGSGSSGMLRVLPETEKYLREKGIRLITEPTEKACQTYNQLGSSQKVIAALHLTC